MAPSEKVQAVLIEAFPPPDRVEAWDEDGITGAVVSPRFEGMEMIDRMNIIWDVLDRGLSLEERRHVLMIIAATPIEAIAHTA